MCGAGLKDIKNPRYNERVFPVPWESDIGVPPYAGLPVSRRQYSNISPSIDSMFFLLVFTGFVFRRSSLGQRANGTV